MAARDRFGLLGNNQLSDPAVDGFAITPSDTDELEEVTRYLYVGGAGNLALVLGGGVAVALTAVPVGLYPIRVRQVKSTGTTATNLVGLV